MSYERDPPHMPDTTGQAVGVESVKPIHPSLLSEALSEAVLLLIEYSNIPVHNDSDIERYDRARELINRLIRFRRSL